MNVFSVLESFLRATEDRSKTNYKNGDDTQKSGSGSDSFRVDINTNSQAITNIPWFLTVTP